MKKRSSTARTVTRRRIYAIAQVPPFPSSPLLLEHVFQGTTGKPKGVEVKTVITLCDCLALIASIKKDNSSECDDRLGHCSNHLYEVHLWSGLRTRRSSFLPYLRYVHSQKYRDNPTHSSRRQYQTLALPLVLRNSRRHTIPF